MASRRIFVARGSESLKITITAPKLHLYIYPGLLPMWHIYQLFCSLVWLRLGTTMVLLKRFEPISFFKAIANHKLGLLPLVPPLILFLCKSPMVKDYDLSNIRDIICGAAPLR